MKFEIPDAFLDGVKKGSVITFEQVRPFVPDADRDRDPWKILLSFQRTLESLFGRSGVVLTIISADSGMSLRILTDEQAADHNRRGFNNYGRRQERRHKLNLGVDLSGLSAEQRRDHVHTLNVQGRVLTASAMARRDPEFRAETRKTPMIGAYLTQGNGVARAATA